MEALALRRERPRAGGSVPPSAGGGERRAEGVAVPALGQLTAPPPPPTRPPRWGNRADEGQTRDSGCSRSRRPVRRNLARVTTERKASRGTTGQTLPTPGRGAAAAATLKVPERGPDWGKEAQLTGRPHAGRNAASGACERHGAETHGRHSGGGGGTAGEARSPEKKHKTQQERLPVIQGGQPGTAGRRFACPGRAQVQEDADTAARRAGKGAHGARSCRRGWVPAPPSSQRAARQDLRTPRCGPRGADPAVPLAAPAHPARRSEADAACAQRHRHSTVSRRAVGCRKPGAARPTPRRRF